jgi:UDP-N-acetylmuramoyl-tripeptide--D-alanyl-D-alanine ligase
MRAMSLAELQAPLQATLIGEDQAFSAVSTDSRVVRNGELFVALSGENFNGHDYLSQVAAAGAAGAVVSEVADLSISQLQVGDTQRALGHLGAFNRQQFAAPVIAITGSSGKTTVKNMVHAVLSQKGNTLATEGNFNNEIGVPLTLLRLAPEFEYAVVEMGAAKKGDIAWLCEIGSPSVALLLNAMPAHLEGFGSVEDVASAKGEIFDGLGVDGCAVINADQPWAAQWRKRAGEARVLDFGLENPAAITATSINARGVEGVSFTASTPEGDIAIRLVLPGRHNVANALAAIAVGLACGLGLTEIRDGLESLEAVSGRLCVQKTSSGVNVIDDCYNANPGSVRAAIDTLADCKGRRILILGVMAELGDESALLHREIGEYARAAGLEAFWGVGPELEESTRCFGEGGMFFPDRNVAVNAIDGFFAAGDTVLVKGSRSAGMEMVLQAILSASAEDAASC